MGSEADPIAEAPEPIAMTRRTRFHPPPVGGAGDPASAPAGSGESSEGRGPASAQAVHGSLPFQDPERFRCGIPAFVFGTCTNDQNSVRVAYFQGVHVTTGINGL